MLWFRRAVAVPALAATRAASFVLHRGLRAYVVRTSGIVHEKRLYRGTPLAGATDRRRVVQVVLDGRLRLDDGARTAWLEAGMVSAQPHGFPDERWEGSPFIALVVEWEPPPGERPPPWIVARLGAIDRARAHAWAAQLEAASAPPVAAAALVVELLAWLRGHGIAVAPVDDRLDAPIAPATRALADALGAALSDLAARPMLVDLERTLARSARHLRRDFAAFDRYYAFPGGASWHRVLHRWRLSVATSLMTAPGATTEGVAATLGYGSPRAFCLAMHQIGLPSPGAIAAAAARLA